MLTVCRQYVFFTNYSAYVIIFRFCTYTLTMEEIKNKSKASWILVCLLGMIVVVCCLLVFSGETDVFKGYLGRSVNVRMAMMQNHKESQEEESGSDKDLVVIERPKESEMPKEWSYLKPVLINVIVNISRPHFFFLK